MNTVFLGIGTNIGNRTENLSEAIKAISHLPNTTAEAVSKIYETKAWGYTEQPDFYNICLKVKTELSAFAFLGACLGIEAAFGRERPFKNAPRIIDLDVLLFNDEKINTRELCVPHPEIENRAFVLVPLHDILPDMQIGDFDFSKAFADCDKTDIKLSKEIVF